MNPQSPHTRLILASSSPYRKQLLERLGLPFETYFPEVDESPLDGERPAVLVARLAALKSRAVLDQAPGSVVIGSDQLAECRGKVVGKPGSVEKARAQLSAFSGATVNFLTALCVLDGRSGREIRNTVETRVVFRHLSGVEIDRYIELDRPLDCAGSFKSERGGIALLERLESPDPTALVGLPLITVAAALREFGFRVP